MSTRNSSLVSWLVNKADGVITGTARRTLLVVPSASPAMGLRPGFLEQPKIRVLTCGADGEAWALAANQQPGLIIQDLDGTEDASFDLCQRFKTSPETRATPLIVIAPSEVQSRIRLASPDAILDRPIVQSEYFDAVSRYIALPQRRYDRHAINLRFSFVIRGRFRQAFSRNLSPYGALLKTDTVLTEGVRIEVDFQLPGDPEPIRCGAIVRRAIPYEPHVQQLAGMAIEFVGIRDADMRRLEAFIERHQQR
jgi:CheY-like chemotaxis protein